MNKDNLADSLLKEVSSKIRRVNCPNCRKPLDLKLGTTVCPHCGSKTTITLNINVTN